MGEAENEGGRRQGKTREEGERGEWENEEKRWEVHASPAFLGLSIHVQFSTWILAGAGPGDIFVLDGGFGLDALWW